MKRNYDVKATLIDNSKIKAKITNVGGPVSAMMMFLNENEKTKIDLIKSIEIVDIDNNNKVVHIMESNGVLQ